MLIFRYYARNISGEREKGMIEASSKEDALKKLREKKLFIIYLQEKKSVFKTTDIFRQKKIPVKDLAILCRQLATMLDAGLPLLSSLTIIRHQTANKDLNKILDKVALKVQEGESLGNAFRQHREIPKIMISMIDVGELGGVLDEVLDRLSAYLENEHIITEKVKTALTYPLLVLAMALLAIVVLFTFVIPSFKQMLGQLGVDLPLTTRILLTISQWMARFWYLLLLLGILIWYSLKIFLKTKKGRLFKDRFIFKLPVFGLLNQKILITRFCSALGTLLRSGIPILTALEVVKKALNNLVVAEDLSQAQVNIRNGGGMAGPLAKSRFFPAMVSQMIAIGEETGRLDRMLEKISDFYTGEVDNMVNRLSRLLEPLLIMVLGSIIASIIFALVLPIFSVISSL